MGSPDTGSCRGEVLEFYCPSCGYRAQFLQGAAQDDLARNLQHIVVVCEKSAEIRNVKVPIDPKAPVAGEPLAAKQVGTGKSKILGLRLPKFIVPGNTCPLFPVSAYLHANVCPIDGQPGFHAVVVGGF